MTARPSLARDAAYAALRAQAQRSARREIKSRAQYYAKYPSMLDTIIAGVSGLSPRRIVESLELLFRPPAWRFFGFGGEIPALNLHGAMLYARFARAKANQLSRRRVA
jgi:hypothetical protein